MNSIRSPLEKSKCAILANDIEQGLNSTLRLLWIVNTIFPEPAHRLGMAPPVIGGWMYGLAADLANSNEINLAVATVYKGQRLKSIKTSNITYYLVPQISIRDQSSNEYWNTIIQEHRPQLVHIHGTEFPHGMALMNAHPNLTYLVSIQGLVSVYHRYYLAGLNLWQVIKNTTLRDLIQRDTLIQAKRKFERKGVTEKKYIKNANAIIGRTYWDESHVKAINPSIPYLFCNESLRDEFYENKKWSLENCTPYSIFVSQAGYPIKGLHQVLKAAALIKNEYPTMLISIAGHDITSTATLRHRLKRGGYGRYIASLIRELDLSKHVKFLGPLQATEMRDAYIRAHVFICPSIIENSPNSLGEAQILGVPCIATYSGGIPSMTKDSVSAVLYPFDEHEMLANHLDRLFKCEKLAETLSNNGQKEAKQRHDRKANLQVLKKIYTNLRNCPSRQTHKNRPV